MLLGDACLSSRKLTRLHTAPRKLPSQQVQPTGSLGQWKQSSVLGSLGKLRLGSPTSRTPGSQEGGRWGKFQSQPPHFPSLLSEDAPGRRAEGDGQGAWCMGCCPHAGDGQRVPGLGLVLGPSGKICLSAFQINKSISQKERGVSQQVMLWQQTADP